MTTLTHAPNHSVSDRPQIVHHVLDGLVSIQVPVQAPVPLGGDTYAVTTRFSPRDAAVPADVTLMPEPPASAVNSLLYSAFVAFWSLADAATRRGDPGSAALYRAAAWAISDYRDDWLGAADSDAPALYVGVS